MATRPVFLPIKNDNQLASVQMVEFEWFPGLSAAQKKKSIVSLHKSASSLLKIEEQEILEISSKSENELGVSLSAFNLMIETKKHKKIFSVESAFQSSKVFESGGPYCDLLDKSSREAKKDTRLKDSGDLVGFRFFNEDWPKEPKTAFYDWIYINALMSDRNKLLAESLLNYAAFTDIEFNPKKSYNCQAYSAALFVSLFKLNALNKALSSKKDFISIISGNIDISFSETINKPDDRQLSLF